MKFEIVSGTTYIIVYFIPKPENVAQIFNVFYLALNFISPCILQVS